MKTGLEAVKERVKSYAALGRFLGITRGAVAQWERVPAEHLGKVAQFTGLPHVVIRPDLFTTKPNDDRGAA
jgi:hypothetical protein